MKFLSRIGIKSHLFERLLVNFKLRQILIIGLSLAAFHRVDAKLVFMDSAENYNVGDVPNPNMNQWGNCSGNCLQVSKDFARAGTKSFKVHLDRRTSKPTYRAEGVVRPVADLDMGAEVWYGFSIYVPKNYEWAKDAGESTMQFHNNKDHDLGEDKTGDPPTILRMLYQKWKINSQYSTALLTTKENKSNNTPTFAPAEAGKWVDWVFHVKWSWKQDGFFQAWKDGKMIRDHKGPNCYNDVKAPKWKLGIYKREWDDPNDTSGNLYDPSIFSRTYYYDEIRAAMGPGSSYSDVAPKGSIPAMSDTTGLPPASPKKLKVN